MIAGVEILGVRVTGQSYEEAIRGLLAAARADTPQRVHFVNVHTIVEAQRNRRLRDVYAGAAMLCTDGMPLAWLARRRGAPDSQRVSGPDVMLSLCDRGREIGLRHYFLGGRPGVAEALVQSLASRFPGLQVVGTHTPPLRAAGAIEDQGIIDAINAAEPDVLWVGLGAPKQELWAADHLDRVSAKLVLPVGAAFDFNSGRVRRAPRWMQRSGLEWLFRLAMDPRRLLGRYVVTNLQFAFLIARERVRGRPEARRDAPPPPTPQSIDRAIRRSWIGRRTGTLRRGSPWLYAALRNAYRRVLSRGRSDGLDPYQRHAVETFLRDTAPDLLAAGVLEVGSDRSGHVLRYLHEHGVGTLVGVNPAWTDGEVDRLRALSPSVSALAVDLLSARLPTASFGAIFSVAVFEHLIDLTADLEEMHRLLLPGGRVFAAFGPIWSSSLGHHIFVDRGDIQLRHWDPRLNPIDDHSHLLLTPDQLRAQVEGRRNRATADAAVAWVYQSDQLNRRFFDDYIEAFQTSRFRVLSIETDEENVSNARLATLRSRHPGKNTFNVRNATVVLEKVPYEGSAGSSSTRPYED